MSIALTDQAKLEGYLLVRRAAKKRRCFVADFFARSGSEKWRPAEGCTPVIDKGDIYLEYLGEAAAYESGTRYCAACALKHWPADVVASGIC